MSLKPVGRNPKGRLDIWSEESGILVLWVSGMSEYCWAWEVGGGIETKPDPEDVVVVVVVVGDG